MFDFFIDEKRDLSPLLPGSHFVDGDVRRLDAKTLETIRTKNLLKEQTKPSTPNSAPANPPANQNTPT